MQKNTVNVLQNSEYFLLGYISSQAFIKSAKTENNFICGHFNLSCWTEAENKSMLPQSVLEVTDNSQDFLSLSSLGFVWSLL